MFLIQKQKFVCKQIYQVFISFRVKKTIESFIVLSPKWKIVSNQWSNFHCLRHRKLKWAFWNIIQNTLDTGAANYCTFGDNSLISRIENRNSKSSVMMIRAIVLSTLNDYFTWSKISKHHSFMKMKHQNFVMSKPLTLVDHLCIVVLTAVLSFSRTEISIAVLFLINHDL